MQEDPKPKINECTYIIAGGVARDRACMKVAGSLVSPFLSFFVAQKRKGDEKKRKKRREPKISKKSELQKSKNEEQIPQPQLPQFDRISFQPSFPPDGDLEFAAHLEVLVRDFNFDLPLMGKDKDKKQGSKKGVTTTNIYLNIYDLTPFNNYLYWFGLGIFHSGIEGIFVFQSFYLFVFLLTS